MKKEYNFPTIDLIYVMSNEILATSPEEVDAQNIPTESGEDTPQ